jgi:predicted TIM-barrel fold metal-dependent hydrolase
VVGTGHHGTVGSFGYPVVDADGHGGEPPRWRRRIPDRYRTQMAAYVRSMKQTYGDVPGGGLQLSDANPRAATWDDDDELDFDPHMRAGMSDPAARLEDMDLEGIDVAVMFPPGSGEEWALHDPEFATALCRTLNDARAEYAAHAPERLKLVAKLPMLDPPQAADELERCVGDHGFVGMVTAQHILDRNLDDSAFDVVWSTAERLGVPVCVHGGGQAPGQVPVAIDRFTTRLAKHAITHPVGAMLALTSFTVGGLLARFPQLRVAFLEAGSGWLPFWLERLDEHWELLPEQAPELDRPPSTYFEGRGFVSCEPEERSVPWVCDTVGDDVVCYASDYCHWDCAFPHSVKLLAERDDLSEARKAAILAGNAARLYGLPVPGSGRLGP